MAFRDLAAADCAGENATFKFAHHLDRDQSLHRDQFQAGPSTQRGGDRFLQEFFEQERQQRMGGDGLRMRELDRELDHISLNEFQQARPGNWADEFQHAPPPDFALTEEFERIYQQHAPPPRQDWGNEFMQNQHQYELRPEEVQEFERLYQSVSDGKITEIGDEWQEEYQRQNEDSSKTWEDEFHEDNFGQMEEIWKSIRGDAEEEWGENTFNPFGPTVVEDKPYEFETDNPFMDHPQPFEEGLQLMNSGNLSDASLAFEAAVQKNPLDAQAWYYLGAVQQENEKEQPAISALREAVKIDPRNLDASLSLAVSYTNEGAEEQALDSLENWIRTRYDNIQFPMFERGDRPRHEFVTGLFLQTVRSSKEVDPDVQVGLGVLFNISCEYQKAVDCFEAALQSRPNDYLLWNRLGATLANGGRSEEAIGAYEKALAIKPSFVRARYNLGVSCINLEAHKEAAEHFLGALALHGDNRGQRNVSNNLWETLRRTFVMMSRPDLLERANGKDVEAFRGEFEF